MNHRLPAVILAVTALGMACSKSETDAPKGAPSASASAAQAAPPDVAAAPSDGKKTDGGVAYKVLMQGEGRKKPRAQDAVRVNYTGWTSDGKMFGSSKAQGRPVRVEVESAIPGWKQILGEMVDGERRRIWVPENLTSPGYPETPKAAVVFDLELVEAISQEKKVDVPPDVGAVPADAEKRKSGLASKVLTKGTGTRHPKASDNVKVHYSGWTTDGKMFDSSVTKGEPATFPLNAVITGWTEGVQLMVEGEKRRFWIPDTMAYKGVPGKPQGMLVFDVELLEIVDPPKAPPDVAKAPADAEKTSTGLASKVLQPGTGKEHPTATSTVVANYSGWTTDGKLFDSSVTRGKPGRFKLTEVIAGWTEGLQLMVPGEKRRFWIPENIAYKGKRGSPKGMLVFDVELIEVVKE